MALLVVMARSNRNADVDKDASGCYKRGDIVAVHDDRRHSGDFTKDPIADPFVLITVQGVDADQLRSYVEPHVETRIGSDAKVQQVTVRRRQFRILLDDISIAKALNDNRHAAITWEQLRGCIEDKSTGQTEDGKALPAAGDVTHADAVR